MNAQETSSDSWLEQYKNRKGEPLPNHKIILVGGKPPVSDKVATRLIKKGYDVNCLNSSSDWKYKSLGIRRREPSHLFVFSGIGIDENSPEWNKSVELAKKMAANGNLTGESVVSTLSNNISDMAEPYFNPSTGDIPFPHFPFKRSFYVSAMLQETMVRELFAVTLSTGSKFVNFVAPELHGWIDKKNAAEVEAQLVQGIVVNLTTEKLKSTERPSKNRAPMPNRRKVYIPIEGSPTLTKPVEWTYTPSQK